MKDAPATDWNAPDWNALSDDAFRQDVRAFLEKHYPLELRHAARRLRWADIRGWTRTLAAKGWLAPAWPTAYGGMGLTPAKLLIFIEEQERFGVARAPDMGVVMVGPILIRHGDDWQKRTYLPAILANEHIWCQGYSEPNAGSDLASLRTEAVADGDDFVITGQKTWTTLAQDATHMFVLARTDKTAKKQAGISFLLVDLKATGVAIRPIKNIAGHEEFCEVFLDAVRTPKRNLVGGLNNGWTIAKALLGFERLFLGSPKQSQYALGRLAALARQRGLFHDAEFVEKFTRLRLDVADLGAAYARYSDMVKRGEPLGAEVSLLKIWATETYQRLTELTVETAGADGATIDPLPFGNEWLDVLGPYYNSRPATIYGGSSEIQRNILAKHVLGLPD